MVSESCTFCCLHGREVNDMESPLSVCPFGIGTYHYYGTIDIMNDKYEQHQEGAKH